MHYVAQLDTSTYTVGLVDAHGYVVDNNLLLAGVLPAAAVLCGEDHGCEALKVRLREHELLQACTPLASATARAPQEEFAYISPITYLALTAQFYR